MSIYAFLSLFAALFTFSLGLLVYLKSSKGKLSTIFLLLSFTVAILSLSQFQMRIANNIDDALLWSKLHAVWPLSMALSLQLIITLNRKNQLSSIQHIILYLPALIFSYIQYSSNLIATLPIENYWGWSMQYNYNWVHNIALAYGIIIWILILGKLIYYKWSFVGISKTQVFIVCIGFCINFIVNLVSDAIFPMLGIKVPEFGHVSDIISFSIIAYGIWRYDIFNLSEDSLSIKLFSAISNDLILVDANKTIIEINSKLLHKLEYTHDEVFGQNLSYLLEPKSDSRNPLSQHISQNSAFKNREVIFKTKKGAFIPLTFTASYVKLDSNIKAGLIYVGTDDGLSKQSENPYFEDDKKTNILAEAALDLVKLDSTDEIYQYITKKTHSLLHKKAIVVCVEDQEDLGYMNWQIKGIEGVHSKAKELSNLLGFDSSKLKGRTKIDYVKNLPDGKLSVIELKIQEYTNGDIPEIIGDKLIKLFGVKELNVIPILHETKISGVISIVKLKNTPPINLELLESFTAIASMVLKRKYYENELAELNNMQNKLFSVIGHDLKSPLSNVLSYTDMILSEYDTFSKDSLKEFFQSIQRSANTGFDILNSLLLWSKSVQGGLPLKPELINIKEIVLEAIEQVMPLAVKKEITVSNKIDENICISADKNMTITVFRNLLSNAIKFTKPNGHIKFDASIQKASAYFSITDDGVGMSQAQLNKLFKLDMLHIGRGTAGEKGSGFGLLICKDFVEKNGGRIEVKSKLREGSIFTLVFPFVNENS